MQSTGKRKVARAKQKELERITQDVGDPDTLGQVRCAARLASISLVDLTVALNRLQAREQHLSPVDDPFLAHKVHEKRAPPLTLISRRR